MDSHEVVGYSTAQQFLRQNGYKEAHCTQTVTNKT